MVEFVDVAQSWCYNLAFPNEVGPFKAKALSACSQRLSYASIFKILVPVQAIQIHGETLEYEDAPVFLSFCNAAVMHFQFRTTIATPNATAHFLVRIRDQSRQGR